MQRRTLLKSLITVSATTCFVAPARAADDTSAAPFDKARWAPNNAVRLQSLLARYGNTAKNYDAGRKPYAVFDWDNTSIMNDCEEALLMHQINTLSFNFSADEFSRVIRQDIPAGAFKAANGYATVEGKAVASEDLADDVAADYRWLRDAQAKGAKLDDLHQTPQFQDFRAKLYFMYDAICDAFPIEVGYKWIIYLLANQTPAEVAALAKASHDNGLGDGLRKVKYRSPGELPGKAGVVVATHFHGLRIHEEIRALMRTLRANGIDVYVSTASLDDVVRVFAGHPNYGYGVAPENVIGLRLESRDGRYLARYRQNWHFNWGPGKSIGIQNELAGKKGYGPVLVLGDSDGDAWMLRDFADTSLGLIVNRLKKGEIGVDSQRAAALLGEPDARFVLQGRDEHTGIMIPDEKSIKFGQSERKLLA
jgi:hypothetical protein